MASTIAIDRCWPWKRKRVPLAVAYGPCPKRSVCRRGSGAGRARQRQLETARPFLANRYLRGGGGMGAAPASRAGAIRVPTVGPIPAFSGKSRFQAQIASSIGASPEHEGTIAGGGARRPLRSVRSISFAAVAACAARRGCCGFLGAPSSGSDPLTGTCTDQTGECNQSLLADMMLDAFRVSLGDLLRNAEGAQGRDHEAVAPPG